MVCQAWHGYPWTGLLVRWWKQPASESRPGSDLEVEVLWEP